MMNHGLYDVTLDRMQPVKTGKVRSIFDLGESYLFVATDRISAYDVVLPTPVPDKGRVLTQISKFWFRRLESLVPHHFLTDDLGAMPCAFSDGEKAKLSGRSMQVRKASVVPVECVVRGYLTGSGWQEYQEKGSVTGIPLPHGLVESVKLETPLFTPATKAESGHDENIPFERMVAIAGAATSERLRHLSLAIFNAASEYLETRGILLADTKFEFGMVDGEIILIDEVLTPDSSRFWPRDRYAEGRAQQSFDKQFVRDYLNSIKFNRMPPGPVLPETIVAKTREKYLEIYTRITGGTLDEGLALEKQGEGSC